MVDNAQSLNKVVEGESTVTITAFIQRDKNKDL